MKYNRSSSFVVTVQGTSVFQFVLVVMLLLLLIFSVSGLITSLKPEYQIKSSSINSATGHLTGEVLYRLLGTENNAFGQVLPEETTPSLSSLMFKMSTNVSLDDPRSLLGRELPGFSIFDGKIVLAGEGTNYTNLPIESPPPPEVLKKENEASLQNIEGLDDQEKEQDEVAPPERTTGDRKIVYIYFSHTRESFLPYLKGVTDPDGAQHSEINVTRIGDHLKEQLERFGIGTVVDKTDIMTKLNEKGLTYGRSYDESRKVVEAAITSNRDLTYLIDIHRDSKRKDKTTKDINGKSYAKLAFVLGAENPNYEKNLKLAKEIHTKLEEKYPGLSRGIIKKEGASTNGKFNQDLSENAMLVEFGGVDNTFEELNRSAEAFADAFSEVFWQAESVNFPVEEPANEQ
ncbi:stage II sporulation protein P [Robertmurraya sp. DFI.2.37]|uniref:stage II sporulation protein P n=1 Tax=Robertmurraya sp. DFI.2.37 TaxID=3031819 RepID=UPI0012444573|nr:stage II sporulation protein P [Robertmurraya sp. DFI.2.37]MDF1508294.1 stage II sporulation protein P [Robertmurraya sp. DFI.2.37]